MSENSTHALPNPPGINPWLLWITCFSSMLIFISLWIILNPLWHYAVGSIALLALFLGSERPLKTIGYILLLVSFLALMQIVFSPFMRDLFTTSLESGFHWSDWQYLLFAVERFALPLAIISANQSKLGNPEIISQLTALLTPLGWFGLRIGKLQILISLSLRFLPSLRIEWERFTHFQTYFVSALPPKTLVQKLGYWQGVFKAMVGHTISRAVSTGEVLALRGVPGRNPSQHGQHFILALFIWIVMGILFVLQSFSMTALWVFLSVWLLLVPMSSGWSAER